jgi:ACS family hexuronate transporter-like MFS transporter
MKHEAAATRAATAAQDRAWIPHLRWYICGLLFLAATINYLDRQTLSVLKNDLSRELNWSEAAYGWINFAFQLAYAVMQGLSGRLVDWLGVRLCFAVAVVVWSLAAMGHAMARGVVGFAIARLMLGLGEGANFPASIKAVAEWFPKKERALATGIFNSGTNVGVMIAPIAVWLAHAIHWQAAFLFTGVVGFGWLVLWLKFYRSPQEHPRLDPEELKFIESDAAPAATEEQAMRIPWIYLLRYRQAWAFFIGKFLTDPVWWFYLYWLPSYLSKERGFSAMASASVLIIPYLAADGGSVFGGLLSSLWIKRGWSVANARLTAMLITAMCMPAAIWAVLTDKGWLSLALISLATAAHQGWSANLFTTSSDLFPKRIVASVVGLGSACGAIGGMLMTLIAGGILQWFGTYVPLFVAAGLMHPLAFIIFIALAGRAFVPANIEDGVKPGPSPVLIGAGAIVLLLGSIGVYVVLSNWSAIVIAAKNSTATAAGGLVAAAGIGLIGALLIYAGLGRKESQ